MRTLKTIATVTLLTLVGTSFAQSDCNNALAISAGTHTVDTIVGTDATTLICSGGTDLGTHTEWYSYTANDEFTVVVSTDLPINDGKDTRFQVYSGSCGNLSCVGGDDDGGGGFLSIAAFQAVQGEEYLIAFDDRWEPSGFDFSLTETPPSQSLVSFTSSGITLSGSAYCITDMDGDHLDDVVGVNGTNINMHFQQPGGSFLSTDVATTQADNTASWSLCAGDLDGNGFNDLLYGGGSGVTFMMANSDGTSFTEISGPEYVFSQRSNMVDINGDGNLDAFVCHDVQPNVFYMNDGFGNLVYQQGGLGNTSDGGNYGSVWTDFDGDHDIDMFIAKCRGGNGPANINQLHVNDGLGNYTEMAGAYNLADSVQTWSSAWGDYDNDGDMDVLVGASSTSNGSHKLMRNDGNTFVDITLGSGFEFHSGTSTEWNTHDYNNDGFLDVFGGGALMLGNGDMTFVQTSISPYNGPVGDLNDDGFQDIQNGSTLYLNNGNSNHYLKVYTVGTASNVNGIGARVEVVTPSGRQIRDVKSGDGFRYMSSMTAHFGLGEDTEIIEVNVYWPSGIINTVSGPDVDQGLEIVEGVNVGIEDQVLSPEFAVFPNPATTELYLSADQSLIGAQYSILSISGQVVLSGSMDQRPVNVVELPVGVYVVRLLNQGVEMHTQFMKMN